MVSINHIIVCIYKLEPLIFCFLAYWAARGEEWSDPDCKISRQETCSRGIQWWNGEGVRPSWRRGHGQLQWPQVCCHSSKLWSSGTQTCVWSKGNTMKHLFLELFYWEGCPQYYIYIDIASFLIFFHDQDFHFSTSGALNGSINVKRDLTPKENDTIFPIYFKILLLKFQFIYLTESLRKQNRNFYNVLWCGIF